MSYPQIIDYNEAVQDRTADLQTQSYKLVVSPKLHLVCRLHCQAASL